MSSNTQTGSVAAPASSTSPTVGLEMSPYSQVAPLTNQQTAGMQLTSDLSQPVQNYLGNAMNTSNYMQSGALMSPSSNPYLSQYATAAMQPQIQQYEQATAPNLLQQAAQSGTLGSAGTAQGFQNAQTALAQGLGTTAADIYEPAYSQGLTATQNAISEAPSLASAQYTPANQLLSSGQLGQTQSQNILNTATQNLTGQANWPFTALSALGQGLNTASGGGTQGVSISSTPSTGAGK